jgi:competence protein ComEC
MVISHSDTDHSGGALTLLETVPTGWVASSLWENNRIVQAARRHIRCAAGQHWRWDGVDFEMLQPAIDSYDNRTLKANARSCTLRVSGGGRSMLLAGDIEAAQEARLVATMPDKLRADVLLAPHHGSGTSSTLAFLRAVAPQVGVFQVGYRNRYHHPKKEVADRYRALGIAQMRTDETGAIELDSADGFAARSYRTEHARYWYGR